jgi:hypothetical protein
MAKADNVTQSFLYVADKSPVLVFSTTEDAQEFVKGFKGAEIFGNKLQVFLPTPHGLEHVLGGQGGQMAYGICFYISILMINLGLLESVFHFDFQAKDWFLKLHGYGTMYSNGDAPDRTILLGREGSGHEYGGDPIYPGVA